MNRLRLVDQMAKSADIPASRAARILEALLELIVAECRTGGVVRVRHFGRFEPRMTATHAGRNPRTGERIVIPACETLGFVPARRMRDVCRPLL